MKKQKKPIKKPPKALIKSVQYDLFSNFVTNNQSEVSNTVELWESIPKYFFTPEKVKKLRTPTGHADPFEWEYKYNRKSCAVVIQPALVKQKSGKYLACFPGVSEELVEETLKKILTDQQYGIHDPKNRETWVRFTLKMIQKELKQRDRMRSIEEIKHAIEVMSSCIIVFYMDDKETWRGSILQDLVTVDREEYLADTDAHHIARLPLFISLAINSLEYRQHNHGRHMSCDGQLSRWINKKLINRFIQASRANNYHFMYTELKASGLLQQKRESDNRLKVIAALEELVERQVLTGFEDDVRKDGRKIVDVKYTVIPSTDFIKDQKAANKRVTDAGAKRGLASVDK